MPPTRFFRSSFCLTALRSFSLLTLCAVFQFASFSPAAADESPHKYMGVASCASSNCHGGVSPRKNSPVLQNEYITWLKKDKHAQAWKVLLSPESKKIAWQLGFEDASKEAACLRCHSTYTEGEAGPKFRVEDGVGCESCHGAAEAWLPIHTASNATHTGNVAHNLTALENPQVRAEKCLSCHQPTAENQFTHRLYGAGHPRISFEVDTYSIIQPAHWLNDQDYTERKGDYIPLKYWLAGQRTAARHSLKLIDSLSEKDEKSLFPELSAYTCSSCHHTLSQHAFMTRDYRAHLGQPHLNLAPVRMLALALKASGELSAAEELGSQIARLDSVAGEEGIEEGTDAIKEILSDKAALAALSGLESQPGKLLNELLTHASENTSLYYETAEQIAMGAESAHAQLTSGAPRSPELDGIFAALQNPDSFNPEQFSEASKKYLKTLPK